MFYELYFSYRQEERKKKEYAIKEKFVNIWKLCYNCHLHKHLSLPFLSSASKNRACSKANKTIKESLIMHIFRFVLLHFLH